MRTSWTESGLFGAEMKLKSQGLEWCWTLRLEDVCMTNIDVVVGDNLGEREVWRSFWIM